MTSYDTEVGHAVMVEVSPDIHICGFCKQQYNNFEVFLAHKQNGCLVQTSEIPISTATPAITDSSAEFVYEETYQTCVMRGVKKVLTKAQKTPSKKPTPALTSKRRSCCFSGCTFKTQYGQKDMERHLKTHTGEKPFECELCHKRFSRRDKLNMHSRSHTGEKPHKCKHCPYAAADSSSLKKHLRIHYDERPFKCQICPYASRNSSQLIVHLRSHTGDAPFQCQQCDAKFKINSDLKRHVRIHSGEKPFKCDFCDYRCAMKGNLKSHVQIKHGSQNSFRCLHCDFQCPTKTALREHTREHRPILPMQCPKCTYSCSSKGALKVHERVHSEERPFKCDFCTFASKQRSNLVIHRRKSHVEKPGKGGGGGGGQTGAALGKNTTWDAPKPASSRYRAKLDAARAFRCDVCNASFVREDSLRSHRKQHRGTHNALQLHLSCPPAGGTAATTNGLGPVVPGQGPDARLQLPMTSDPLGPYSSAQLKIIVSHPLAPEEALVQAAAADGPHQAKTNVLLLSAEDQELAVGSMIQQVGLLSPVQPPAALGGPPSSHYDGGGGAAAVLLTPLGQGDMTVQALLQGAAGAPQGRGATQTFLATCSDIEGLSALIQEGGTEVTVVTEGIATATASTASGGGATTDGAAGTSLRVTACVDGGALACVGGGGGLLVPSIHLGGAGVVLHGLPLIMSSQPHRGSMEQLATSGALYTDSPPHMEGMATQ